MGMFFNRPDKSFGRETHAQREARLADEKALLAKRQAEWLPLRGEPLRQVIKTFIEDHLEGLLDERVDIDMHTPLSHYDMDDLEIVFVAIALEEIFEIANLPHESIFFSWSGEDFYQLIQGELEARD